MELAHEDRVFHLNFCYISNHFQLPTRREEYKQMIEIVDYGVILYSKIIKTNVVMVNITN